LTDTTYDCYLDIESRKHEAGDDEAVLVDPYLEPPGWPAGIDNARTEVALDYRECGPVSDSSCWGWEDYENGGLQNAMAHHPVVVSEFGWRDRGDCSAWLRGSCEPSLSTTETYGKPLLAAFGEDERVSWLAWNADVRWLPTMFRVGWTVAEGGIDLTEHNWYETDIAALGDQYTCSDLPCEWTLTSDPNEGEYIKQVLAERATQQVPFSLGPTWPANASDPDGDNRYEDLDGDGRVTFVDVNEFFRNSDTGRVSRNAPFYDFTGDGSISLQDVMALFENV